MELKKVRPTDEQLDEIIIDICQRIENTMINCIRIYRHYDIEPVHLRTCILQTFVISHLGHIIRESLWNEQPEKLCDSFMEHLNHNLRGALSTLKPTIN